MNIKIFERATESEIQKFLDEEVLPTDAHQDPTDAHQDPTDAHQEPARKKNVHQVLQSECAISSDDGATFFSNLTVTIFWD